MDYLIFDEEADMRVMMTGELTLADHGRIRHLIGELMRAGPTRLVLDLTRLEFIDSAGVGMLLIAHEEAGRHGKELVLREPRGQVLRVLDLAHLDKVVCIQK
jgi:HptB-dependent secretion and biofilm anti anti-sigma factor